jgi:exodeoxyribonuclease VII large subunit
MSGVQQTIYTVTQVNTYIKSLLDGEKTLNRIYIRGEISNYKRYPSGHHYFSLKDEQGTLRCVMFRSSAARLRFRPDNGMQVIAFGRVSVFPRDGGYQLYVDALTPDGAGDLYLAFEQLKAKLYAEGLFDPAHKKPIPAMPERIGIITSSAGAAVHDMLRILNARWNLAEVKLLPVRVQGVEAPEEIAGAIAYANRWQVADLLIVGRGGGSMEDLWAFNDERVARAIYASEIPIISAVGHEPDVTIADFVADLRAATPSNGAELAVPDKNDVYAGLRSLTMRLNQAQGEILRQYRTRLERCAASRVLTDPMTAVTDRRLLLDYTQQKLTAAVERRLNGERQQFAKLSAGLDAMSPLKVLGRGYAVAQKGKTVVSSLNQVETGERIDVRISDGVLNCTVCEKRSFTNGSKKKEL